MVIFSKYGNILTSRLFSNVFHLFYDIGIEHRNLMENIGKNSEKIPEKIPYSNIFHTEKYSSKNMFKILDLLQTCGKFSEKLTFLTP